MQSSETWKPVRGYETRYEVSDLGRVRSLQFRGNGEPEIMTPTRNDAGYHVVTLGRDRKQKRVHVLVLEAFIGPRPKGMQACHEKDDKENNSLKALRWDTPKNNISERKSAKGENHGRAKITDVQRDEIIEARKNGEKLKSIGARYGISDTRVSQIANFGANVAQEEAAEK